MTATDSPAPRRTAQVRTWELLLFQALFAVVFGVVLFRKNEPGLSPLAYHPFFLALAASVSFIAFIPGEWAAPMTTRFTWHGRLAIISNSVVGLILLKYFLDRPHGRVHCMDGITDSDMAARGLPPQWVLYLIFVLTAIAVAGGVKCARVLRGHPAWMKWLPLLAATLQAASLLWLTPYL